jgi:exonuclease SbcC
MRPISMTIEGLTAFRQPQFVDFNDLDLFVITGPTGAGKTSILDALTFALYGKVFRVKSTEMRDLITHHAAFARVELKFEVRGTLYHLVRHMKRKGPTQVWMERKSGDEFIPVLETPGTKGVEQYIEALLGLDFEAFTKAVLLPQGRFQEFLSGDADTRRSILNRLLELDRYVQMGARARQKAKDIATALTERTHWLEQDYGDATKEHLAELLAQIKEAQATAKAVAKVRDRITATAVEAQRASSAVESIDREIIGIRSLIDTIERAQETARGSETRDQETIKLLAETENVSTAADTAETAAVDALAATVTTNGGDEVALNSLLAQARTLATETARLSESAKRLVELKAESGTATVVLVAATKAAAAAEADMESARQDGERLRDEHLAAERIVTLARDRERLKSLDIDLERLNKALAAAGKEREKHTGTLEHLRTEHSAAALRSGLHAGDACPVCEQIIATLPAGQGDVDQQVVAAQTALNEAAIAQNKIQDEVSGAKRERVTLAQSIGERETVLPNSAARLTVAKAEATMQTFVKQLEAARAGFPAKSEAFKLARSTEQTARDAANAVLIREQEAEKQQLELSARIDQAKTALTPIFGESVPDNAAATIEARLATVASTRQAAEKARQNAQTARRALQQARTDREAFEKDLTNARNSLEQVRGEARGRATALQTAIPDQPLHAAPDGDATAPLLDQITSLQEFCLSLLTHAAATKEATVEKLSSVVTTLAEIALEAGIEGDGLSADEITQLAERAHRDAEFAVREGETVATNVQTRIARRQELEQSMEEDRSRQQLYQRLGLELQADRFLAYVLGESMRMLAAQATSELKRITNNRYSIEPRDSNFGVIDHFNADEGRSVATLSGGETFLASLALALALAGSVRDLAGNAAAARLESMFIDEGFGALDAETLVDAVNALEQLAGDHRMIGVISHVPALAERIQSGIEVRKVGASSTVVRR